MAEPDLSRIVNLIMENPKLIEEIKNLGAKDEEAKEAEEAAPREEEKSAESVPTVSGESISRARRKDLLCALKPYVSEERGRAIDSMMSIADILDMMRSK